MNKVLLHIGFPKAGSTFLGDWFHRHPDIIFRDFAIGGFKDTTGLIDFAAANPVSGNKVFVLRDMRFTSPDDSNIKELSNIEDFQHRVAVTLHALFPGAKVLIVTRGFESALKANYSQYLKQGGRLIFNRIIEKNRNSRWIPFNYSYIIKLYNDLFGHENVLVLPFELLKTESAQFLGAIEQFFELGPFEYHPAVRNRSLSPGQMALFRKMNKFWHIALFLFGPLQIPLFRLYLYWLDSRKTRSWNNPLIKVLAGPFKPIEFGLSREELSEIFKPHAEILRHYPAYRNYKAEYFIDD
jgi:hypothetical protein